MKEFDFNKLTDAQIISKGMGNALIADDENFLSDALTKAGFTDTTDDEWEAARVGAQVALESVSRALKVYGLEIRNADMVEYTGWILVPKGITEKKFGKLLVA